MIYLYVKQCSHCDKKYFGKTESKDPYKYKGSGKYWNRHLKHHDAKHVTLFVWSFDDKLDSIKFALNFSKENNIVESNAWFNLQEENALDGNPKGNIPSNKGKSSKLKGLSYEDIYGLDKAEKLKTSRSLSNIKRGNRKEETKKKIGDTRKRLIKEGLIKINKPPIRPENLQRALRKIKCNHCDTIASYSNIMRWHNDKCKLKLL